MYKYIKGSLLFTFIGLITAMGFQYWQTENITSVLVAGWTALILAVLEISLSFDNAVVNATVIRKMDPVWKKRFLTWGILIAVFGMRLIFPVTIVGIVANINPIEAFKLSIQNPARYSELMTSTHLTVAAFGGMFLYMVFLHFFMNEEKEDHWVTFIEKPLVLLSQYKGIELIVALLTLLSITSYLSAEVQKSFLVAGLWGMITYMTVHSFSDWLEEKELMLQTGKSMLSAGFGMFLYLEILDASFSFDGVIGAFAITQSLVQIMIGLSIGAFFVRSLTLYLVEKNTLNQFRFLEHGAFYALGALAMMMLLDSFFHIPEWMTGLTGAIILAFSILWSFHVDRKSRTE